MAGRSAARPEHRTGAAGENPVLTDGQGITCAWPVPRDMGHHTERDPVLECLAEAQPVQERCQQQRFL